MPADVSIVTNDGLVTTERRAADADRGIKVAGIRVVGPQQAAITDLNQDISAAYVEAEVQAISDKVDEVLAMLRVHGLIATE